jgi:nucleoside-diphosphate-sugar epimerase
MPAKNRVLVTGAGGFIDQHLVTYLKARGYWVRAVLVSVLGWESAISRENGLAKTYPWIEQQVSAQVSKQRAAVG